MRKKTKSYRPEMSQRIKTTANIANESEWRDLRNESRNVLIEFSSHLGKDHLNKHNLE